MIDINEFCLAWYIETHQTNKPYNEEVEQIVNKLKGVVMATKIEVERGWRNRYEEKEVKSNETLDNWV